MTYAEALALLTPEEHAELDELVDNAPPLTEAQQRVLAALFVVSAGQPAAA